MVITRVDEYFLRSKVEMPYPSVIIEDKDVTALPVVLEALDPGTVSVIFEYDGKFNVPNKKISCDALTLLKLLKVYNYTLVKSPNERYEIRSGEDILEAGVWSS